jgi:hypothetical protein
MLLFGNVDGKLGVGHLRLLHSGASILPSRNSESWAPFSVERTKAFHMGKLDHVSGASQHLGYVFI